MKRTTTGANKGSRLFYLFVYLDRDSTINMIPVKDWKNCTAHRDYSMSLETNVTNSSYNNLTLQTEYKTNTCT